MRKDVFYYFKKCIAFFDIKAKQVPPVVFLLILALYALSSYIIMLNPQAYDLIPQQGAAPGGADAANQASFVELAGLFFVMMLINAASFVYLDAAIRDARGIDYTARDCIVSALKNFPRLMGVTIVKNIVIFAGMCLFVIPGIYMMVLLVFAESAILDKGARAMKSLRSSGALTKGRRGEIFKIELFCNLIIAIFIIILLLIFQSINAIAFNFVMLFVISLITLINFKLVAHLYADAILAKEGPGDIAAWPGGAGQGDIVAWPGGAGQGGGDSGDSSDSESGGDDSGGDSSDSRSGDDNSGGGSPT